MMTFEKHRFKFTGALDMCEVKDTLRLSVLAVESLHGKPGVRLEASFTVDAHKKICVVDASTDVGRDLVRIFTGYLTREFGPKTFSVKKETSANIVGGGGAK